MRSDLGPRRLCAEKYVTVMSTVSGCDVTTVQQHYTGSTSIYMYKVKKVFNKVQKKLKKSQKNEKKREKSKRSKKVETLQK